MGGRSFMVAARIPMPREGFDAWLRTPPPGPGAIDNPSAMYTGWALDGAEPDWGLTALAAYPAAVAAILAARAATGLTPARHRDGAPEVYLYDYHGAEHRTQPTC
ncbi:hypothetical protein [Streptomyces sp. NRRL B-24484]|uniref:hypothetical protein n=1 Tax=Streptomyces sp. NRRL B-24484 TaxID=1463833 RepID=UPI0004BFF408|nr:hypothetical protein [Streptomyces sp. NRRL B-24484]